ncbi:MAG: hypothetical protein U1E65_12830 [Myxococcota bacterium]
MMRLSYLLALPAIVSCAASGAEGHPGKSVDLARYVPLAVGSSYTYDVHYPGQDGEMTVNYLKIEDGYLVDDRKGALRLTPEGLRDHDRFLIKTPVEVGSAWKTVVGPSAIEHAQVIAVGDPCEAIAGKFPDCLVVHSWIKGPEMTLHMEWSWAKDVGLVRFETTADLGPKGKVPQIKQSLKRYTVGGQTKGVSGGHDDGPASWTQ